MKTNRRRIILINKKFQVRFAAYMVGWMSALCFIYPLLVKNLFDYFFRYTAHDPLGPDLANLLHVRKEVLLLICLTEIAFLAMTFLMCLFVSHRIAGPLYKLTRCFDEYGEGKFNYRLAFRTKDYFQDVAESFNRMVEKRRNRTQQEEEMLASAISRLESSLDGASPELREKLEPALVNLRKLQEQQAAKSAAAQTPAAQAVATTAEAG